MLRVDCLYEYASFVPKEQQKEVWEEWAADGGPKDDGPWGRLALFPRLFWNMVGVIQNLLFLSCPTQKSLNHLTQP